MLALQEQRPKAGEAMENALSDLELLSPGKGEADVQSQQESLGCAYPWQLNVHLLPVPVFHSLLIKKADLCISKAAVLGMIAFFTKLC